jgi:hypothetical protein
MRARPAGRRAGHAPRGAPPGRAECRAPGRRGRRGAVMIRVHSAAVVVPRSGISTVRPSRSSQARPRQRSPPRPAPPPPTPASADPSLNPQPNSITATGVHTQPKPAPTPATRGAGEPDAGYGAKYNRRNGAGVSPPVGARPAGADLGSAREGFDGVGAPAVGFQQSSASSRSVASVVG